MPKNSYKVGGQEFDSANKPPPTDRTFRDAWVLSGDVIEIDMPTARRVHRENLAWEAQERVVELERIIWRKKMAGEDSSAEEQEKAALEGPANPSGLAAINNAASPQALKAVTLKDLFG